MKRHDITAPGLIIATFLASVAPTRAQTDGCPASGGTPAEVSAISPRLELRLADSRLVRLVGLEAASVGPRDPNRTDAAHDALAVLLRGRKLMVQELDSRPDRWGRIAAFAFLADGPDAGRAGGVAAAAIATGLARFSAEPAAHSCRAELLSAEETARRAALGLWRDPYYSVLAVDDRDGFAERAGHNVLVEARLAAIEPGPYRTTLRFGLPRGDPHVGRRFTATILPRAMKKFEAQGVDFTSLIGRTIRLRGLLDQRFGPQVELAGPDDVEVLPMPSSPAK